MSRLKFACVLLALGLIGLSGCYRHVVRTEGSPPGRYDIYEPNLPEQSHQRLNKEIQTKRYGPPPAENSSDDQ